MPATDSLIRLRDVSRVHESPAGRFVALDGVSLDIAAGELVAVVGPSGSGKSTLLNLLGGIDRPTGGEIRVREHALHTMSERELSRWRGLGTGIVFQFFLLMPTLTALENVLLAMDVVGRWPARERRERALVLLERLGVADQRDKLPAMLSGGQQQRVAVARALANEPMLLLADEPTGNLDSRNAGQLLELLGELSRAGQTIVLATHQRDALRSASRVVALRDGRVVERDAAHA